MFIIGWIIFGALTGWLASKIVNKRGEGCMVNIALGLVGAVVGGSCSAVFRRSAMKCTASSFRPSWR